eukprot:15359552-Ditylum_brightwellii.AAC.1
MKDIGLHVVYAPPIVHHDRSVHDYLSDFSAEGDLYEKTTKLLEFLEGWSSDADTLSERIYALWVGLYEHDYLGEQDVHAAREWLNTLVAIGYRFPDIHGANSNSNPLSTTSPFQVQPTVKGQPYRSFPYFNVDRDGNRFSESGQNKLQYWLSNVDWESRPQNAVVKLILMTMDEWPLLKSWVMYHGELLGYENLYIIDSSTNTHCISFLRYARDVLGANVLFSDTNLNEVEALLTEIGRKISGSSDFILK